MLTLRSVLCPQRSSQYVTRFRSPLKVCAIARPSYSLGNSSAPITPSGVPAFNKTRVLPLLSELVEIQARTSAFETLAGRSACIGFAVALAAEVLLPHSGLFGGWQSAQQFFLLVAVLVSLSATLAVTFPHKRKLNDLLEPVIASLTSRSRSENAIIKKNVDAAVDSALDQVFNGAFLRQVFPIENEFQLGTMMSDSEFESDSEDIHFY